MFNLHSVSLFSFQLFMMFFSFINAIVMYTLFAAAAAACSSLQSSSFLYYPFPLLLIRSDVYEK